jgi:hypothetical protein
MRASAGLRYQFDVLRQRRGFGRFRYRRQPEPGRDGAFMGTAVAEQILIERLNDDQGLLARGVILRRPGRA